MINLTYAQIRHPEFNPVLTKIVKSKMPYPSAKRVLDIMHAIKAEQTKSDEAWALLVEKYLEPIDASNPQGFMQIKAALDEKEKAEAETAIEEFAATPVEIPFPHLSGPALQYVELSPVDLERIKDIIDDE